MGDHETIKNSTLKKILFFWIFFVFIASILGTILVLYALGYRYDLKNKKIVLVSVVYLNSQPQGADVYLEGKHLGKTKLIFPKITPGLYNLSLKKDGFYDWSANINIEPYSLVEISPALFYQKPQTITSVSFDKLLAFQKGKILYQNKGSFFIKNINSESPAEKITLPQQQNISFSPSAEYLAVETEKEWLLFDGGKTILTKPETKLKKWLITDAGLIYFLNTKNELWQANQQKTEKKYSDIKDFDFKENKLWLLTKKGELLAKSLATETQAEKTIPVANDSLSPIKITSLSFCNFPNVSNLICLKNNQGYFIFLNNKELYWLGKEIKSLAEKENMFAWLNNEGDIYIVNNGNIQFVNRYFNPPTKIDFFSPEHLILQYPQSVKILEIETKQEFPIFKTPQTILETKGASEKEIIITTNKSLLKIKITEANSLWQKVMQTFRR